MKFKVGDRVRAISTKYAFTNKLLNWEGIVVKVYEKTFDAITSKINYDDLKDNTPFYDLPYKDFELIISNPLMGVEILVKEFINENKEKFDKVDFKYEIKAKKPILDDVEKEYLSNVIKPFKNRILSIKKVESYYLKESIEIVLMDNDALYFPFFKKGTMYKGMKLSKEYSLEELDL